MATSKLPLIAPLILGLLTCACSAKILALGPPPNTPASPPAVLKLPTTVVSIPSARGVSNPNAVWDPAIPPLQAARGFHTATVIQVGAGSSRHPLVLIAGGLSSDNIILQSAYLYDPARNTFVVTSPMLAPRMDFFADIIRIGSDQHEAVLISGGWATSGAPLVPTAACEIFDPQAAGGVGAFVSAASLNVPRGFGTTTRLNDGRIVMIGGTNDRYTRTGYELSAVEIYDASLNTWTSLNSLPAVRAVHTATLIKVDTNQHDAILVTGGIDISNNAYASALILDLSAIASGVWSSAGSMPVAVGRHAATLLSNGAVLVGGGTDQASAKFPNTEVYQPSLTSTPSITWISKPNYVNGGVYYQTLQLLPNGIAFSIGGFDGGGKRAVAELYDPSAAGGTWSSLGAPGVARSSHTVSLLPDGRVVVFGGESFNSPVMTQAEALVIYQTYAMAQSVIPSSGTAPYSYRLSSGTGTLYVNGNYVPNQFAVETATIEVTDAQGAKNTYSVATLP